MPSTPRPLAFWNASTAAFVLLPKMPSTLPQSNLHASELALQSRETHYEIRAPDIDVTVNPAAGDSLDTVALTLPYADTGKHAYTPDWSKLPSGQT